MLLVSVSSMLSTVPAHSRRSVNSAERLLFACMIVTVKMMSALRSRGSHPPF